MCSSHSAKGPKISSTIYYQSHSSYTQSKVFITVLCLQPRRWLVIQSIVTLMSWVRVWLDLIVYKYIHRVKPLNPFCWKIKKKQTGGHFKRFYCCTIKSTDFYWEIRVQSYDRLLPGIQRAKIKTIIKLNYHHAHILVLQILIRFHYEKRLTK